MSERPRVKLLVQDFAQTDSRGVGWGRDGSGFCPLHCKPFPWLDRGFTPTITWRWWSCVSGRSLSMSRVLSDLTSCVVDSTHVCKTFGRGTDFTLSDRKFSWGYPWNSTPGRRTRKGLNQSCGKTPGPSGVVRVSVFVSRDWSGRGVWTGVHIQYMSELYVLIQVCFWTYVYKYCLK